MDVSRPLRPRQFRIDEIAEIIALFKRHTQVEGRGPGESYALIAPQFGRTPDSISRLVRRFQPSVDGAEAYIKANALKLAMRVVRKANVDQSIDILQRTNVGVLAPKQEAGGGQGGFFLSVQAENLGAVRIGVAALPASPQRFTDLPQPMVIDQTQAMIPASATSSVASADAESEAEIEEVAPEPLPTMTTAGVPHPNQGKFRRTPSADQLAAIERNKQKLTEARRLRQLRRNRQVGL